MEPQWDRLEPQWNQWSHHGIDGAPHGIEWNPNGMNGAPHGIECNPNVTNGWESHWMGIPLDGDRTPFFLDLQLLGGFGEVFWRRGRCQK